MVLQVPYRITNDGTSFWIAYYSGDDHPDGTVTLSFDLNEETYETVLLPVGKVPFLVVINFLGDKLACIHDVDYRLICTFTMKYGSCMNMV